MFKKATKSKQKLKLLLQAPSGGGKTYSSLLLASEIAKSEGKRVAVLDTENGSASLYADLFDFDVMELTDFSVNSYVKAMNSVKNIDDYSVLVIDSTTPEWEWVLNQVTNSSDRNKFTAWNKPSEYHEQFKKAILMFNKHLICTVRAKQEYAQTEGSDGKKKIEKLGLAPIQRDGFEYEFTTAFMIDTNNYAVASKDRTALFKHKGSFIINETVASELLEWLNNTPKQGQMEALQAIKEQMIKIEPTEYIALINEESGLASKISSNTELMCELKNYAMSLATDRGYKLNSDKTSFVKADEESAQIAEEDKVIDIYANPQTPADYQPPADDTYSATDKQTNLINILLRNLADINNVELKQYKADKY
ncbi:MAG: AAA family ATPase, partial [Waterburya sp.]